MVSLTIAGRKPAHSVYRKSVKPASDNMLKPGTNNAKLGGIVTAKKWQGMAMYSLTLEERTTCPITCEQWNNCYGNNMPFAHRFDHTDPNFLSNLDTQLDKLSKKHPQGFVVRLHVLGDFFSDDYVKWWRSMLQTYPQLHAFGYTHVDSRTSIAGVHIEQMNRYFPDQWQIRFSDDKSALSMTAHVVDKAYVPVKGSEVICPEQLGTAASCAACGLCWSAPNRKIMFVEH